MTNSLLKINNLNTKIFHKDRIVNAANDIDLELNEKEILCIIGESGCGKTISMLSLANLLPDNAKVIQGRIEFEGNIIDIHNETTLENIRGSKISYVFQDATSYLNPIFTIGEQIEEVLIFHNKLTKQKAKDKTLSTLELVNLKPALHYFNYYPHQLSGGMNQRAMIAMSIASNPKLLIADEPTSSLDRITEIKILNLLKDLRDTLNLSIILITHNISVVESFADKVAIMYAGRIVEVGRSQEVLNNPKHPYTIGLLECIPKQDTKEKFLKTIKGSVPDLANLPEGCKFNPRCPFVMDICKKKEPNFRKVSNNQSAKCYLL